MTSRQDRPTRFASRREVLSAGAAVATASVLGRAARTEAAPSSSTPLMPLPGAEELVPEAMPSGFSAAELERRWAKCRAWLRRADFDALIVPARPQGNADIKWLIESGAHWVVFPQDGRPTAIFRTSADAAEMRRSTSLDIDIVSSRLRRSQLVIDALKKAGVTSGRVGVGDLEGTNRNDEGGVSHTAMVRIESALPNLSFVSAADFLMRIKLARGPEEIEVLKLATRASELGLKALVEASHVGAQHWEVWFLAHKALIGGSGEAPGRLSFRTGAEGNTAEGQPLREVFQAGQFLSEEISASVLGYNSQVNQTMCVGRPVPKLWAATFAATVELFEELIDWAKPGRSFTDFSAFYKQRVDAWTDVHGGDPYFGVVFHTGGALGDGPRMGWGRPDENRDLVITPGMVFTIKPRLPIPGIATPSAQVGDAVLITETGAERLGRRTFEPLVLDSA